jgi:drug/metabolite transporter (DMT)-like permease
MTASPTVLPSRTRRESLQADAAMVLVTLIWGTTFPLNKQILETLPPFAFMVVRFTMATASLALLARGNLLRMDRRAWGAAFVLALFMFAGFSFQIFGLRLTTPTKSAFLTCVSVPLVPFVGLWLLRNRPPVQAWIGCALAFAGSMLLTYQPGILMGPGDLLSLACAVLFAFQIVLVSRFMPGRNAAAMTTAVCFFTILFAVVGWAVAREPVVAVSAYPWKVMLWLGVIATGVPLLVQNWAQKHTSAVHAAIIFGLEPVFAAFFSYLWLGDQMALRAWIGSGVILAGIVISEL